MGIDDEPISEVFVSIYINNIIDFADCNDAKWVHSFAGSGKSSSEQQ